MDSDKILKLISERYHMDKTAVEACFNMFVEEMIQALKGGNDITISGFGDFTILVIDGDCQDRRWGCTGTSKKRKIKFVPSKEVDESLNRW